MSIRVALNHKTSYRYSKPVWLSPHVVRLRPAPHCRTPVTSYSLKVTPAEHFMNWQQDPYSNLLARLIFPKKTKEFSRRSGSGGGYDRHQSVRFFSGKIRGRISF